MFIHYFPELINKNVSVPEIVRSNLFKAVRNNDGCPSKKEYHKERLLSRTKSVENKLTNECFVLFRTTEGECLVVGISKGKKKTVKNCALRISMQEVFVKLKGSQDFLKTKT